MEAYEASLRLDLSLLRGLRRQLQSWLADIGVPDDAAEDVVLATHEAAANAIEHAEFGTEVTVRSTRDDDQVIVVVTNSGPWKRPRSMDESRGRGLVLMENLMSEVDIQARSKVTVVRMCKDLSLRKRDRPPRAVTPSAKTQTKPRWGQHRRGHSICHDAVFRREWRATALFP